MASSGGLAFPGGDFHGGQVELSFRSATEAARLARRAERSLVAAIRRRLAQGRRAGRGEPAALASAARCGDRSGSQTAVEKQSRDRRDYRCGGLVGAGISIEKQREAQQRLRQADVDKSAVRTAKALLEDVLRAYNDRSLDLAGAEGLAAIQGDSSIACAHRPIRRRLTFCGRRRSSSTRTSRRR